MTCSSRDAAFEVLDLLGDAGRHVRSIVGMAQLPLRPPAEVGAIIAAAL